MKKGRVVTVIGTMLCIVLRANSQVYLIPNAGLKLYQLKGETTVFSSTTITQVGVVDYRTTAFQFGADLGGAVLKAGPYGLDLTFGFEWSRSNFVEEGYDSMYGSDSYVKNGSSGGATTNVSLALTSVHRIDIPGFDLLSPFVGAGIALDFFSTNDVQLGSPSNTPTPLKGANELLAGLIVSCGTTMRMVPFTPQVQLKYYTPFSRKIQLTKSPNASLTVNDRPDYLVIAVGLRFDL